MSLWPTFRRNYEAKEKTLWALWCKKFIVPQVHVLRDVRNLTMWHTLLNSLKFNATVFSNLWIHPFANAYLEEIADPWYNPHSNQTRSQILSCNNNVILNSFLSFLFVVHGVVIKRKKIWRFSIILPQATFKKTIFDSGSTPKYWSSTDTLLIGYCFLKIRVAKLRFSIN